MRPVSGYIGFLYGLIQRMLWGCLWDYIGIMEKKMETTIVYRGYIRIMEKKMETIIQGLHLGLFRGYIGRTCKLSAKRSTLSSW